MRPSRSTTVVATFAAAMCFAASGGLALAVAADFVQRDTAPLGSAVSGTGLAGLDRAEAARVVRERVADPLLSPLEATYQGGTVTIDAEQLVHVDVDGMVSAALRPNRDGSLPSRVAARLAARPLGGEADVKLEVDAARTRALVLKLARDIDLEARDATRSLAGVKFSVVPSRKGQVLDRPGAERVLTKALMSGEKTVRLPVRTIEPKITEKSLGKTIVVDLPQRRLWLYDVGKLEKEYRVAIGQPRYPTPAGEWTIVNKRYLPTWRNPGSAWAKDMPDSIGPGPSNPLGTRALDLNASGIRIHGTSKDGSIGTAASHGCVRMHRWDIEDLFPRVPVGTRVYIIR